MSSIIKDKRLVLGVSGGIAAYKAVELLRLLTGAGASVRVIMTRSAKWFVGDRLRLEKLHRHRRGQG